jgi:hypothetical protein
MHQSHRGRQTRQVGRLLHRRVPAADHHHRLAAEEGPVADRARADALVLEELLVGKAEVVRARTGGDDDRLGEVLRLLDPDLEGTLREVDLAHVGGDDLGALALGLVAEALHQLLARHLLGEAGVVLDVGREHELPARDEAAGAEALDAERLEVGARRIDGRSEAGGAGTDDDGVANFRHGLDWSRQKGLWSGSSRRSPAAIRWKQRGVESTGSRRRHREERSRRAPG